MKSAVIDKVHLCPICQDEVVPAGRRLCVFCTVNADLAARQKKAEAEPDWWLIGWVALAIAALFGALWAGWR